MSSIFAAFTAIGALWGGFIGVGAIVASTLGAVVIGSIAGALVGYAFEELMMPDVSLDSPTYKSGQPVYTIEEGKPIAKCYGRCRIAGNIIRSNDPGEEILKIIIGHGHGEIDSLLAWKINNTEWDSLKDVKWWNADYSGSVHFKNTSLGTDSQTLIQVDGENLFFLDSCAYRGIVHTGFKLKKNSQIAGLGTVLVEGRFSLCEPIGGGVKVFSRNPAVIMWDFYRNVEGYEIADLDINAFTSLETLCDFCPPIGEGGPIRPPGPNSTTVKATSYHDSRYCPFFAFDINKPIEGTHIYNEWTTEQGTTTFQRLNVDLGIPVILKKIVLVNSHLTDGGETDSGIQHFSIQGSNTASDLDHIDYADGASGWTNVQIGLTATQWDADDPYKDYEVTIPKPAYRYYSIKIVDNHGNASWMKVRDICFWGRSPRYTFDFNFDSKININDAKKLIWSSFDGRVIRSQGKLKPVWDWATMANGSGGLTAKTSQYSFTMDNIVKDSFVRLPAKRSNKVTVEYLDSSEGYKKIPVTEKDDSDIDDRGEVTLDVKAYYITQKDVAARKCKRLFYRALYSGDQCELTGFPSSQKLEVYDLVQVTHTIPSWTAKEFIVLSKAEDEYGRPTFLLRPYYTGFFDDVETPISKGHASIFPRAWDVPPSSTGITVALVGGPGSQYDYRSVKVSFTPPANYLFYSHTEIYASRDDTTYYLVGTSSGEDFVIQGMGMLYYPGDTCYVKLKNVSRKGVTEPIPVDADASVVISGTIRSANFYLGLNDIWGGNATIGNVATTIVLGNDGVSKIALGTTADSLSISNMATYAGFFADGQGYFRGGGANKYIQWNGEITIKAGADFLIDSANQKMTLGSGNNLIALDAADASYRLAIGHATYGSAPFRVTKAGAVTAISGVIGGWTLATTTLSSANITLDQANDRITVNTITIDGANDRVRSNNYVSGYAGAGFTLEPDLLEVGNIACRGIFRTSVFQKDTISVIGGNILVRPGDVLATDMTAADNSTLTLEGNETFSVGHFLRIKDGTDDEWLEVTNIASAPTYIVTRDKAGNYAANANPAWTKGATVVNYGASGDGGVYMTASETNAPYLSIYDHAGVPWTTINTRLRIGNLNGILGYTSDLYGIAIGETNKYLKYDPTNGLRIKGDIDVSSMYAFPSDENLVGYWPLDDGSGAVAVDASGNDNDGTLVNMEDADWKDGIVGKCLDFDGTNEYVTIDDHADLDFGSGDFSISFWASLTTYADLVGLITKVTGNYWSGIGFRFTTPTNPNVVYFRVVGDAGSIGLATGIGESYGWTHFVGTRSGNVFIVYINGVLIATDTVDVGDIDNNEPLYIGKGVNGAYNGKIDEVRVYKGYALTLSEIKALYLYPAGNKGTRISGNQITTGVIQSTNWAVAAGMQIDLDNATIKIREADGLTIAHGADVLFEHGGDLKFTSVTAPTACTGALAGAGAGNVNNGDHYYKIIYVNAAGETELGAISNLVTVADKAADGQVSLTGIPVSSSSSVTKRKIYRTKAGASIYFYLDEIANNTGTTYTDNIADASLGSFEYNNKVNNTSGKLYVDGIGSMSLITSNAFIGQYAGANNSTGYANTAIGSYGLTANTIGNRNTAMGDSALYSNVSGNGNVALGRHAGRYELGNNAFYVNNQDRINTAGDKSKSILYGVMDFLAMNQTLTINAVAVVSETLKITERAAAKGDTAGMGQLWVKNTTPCQLWFTDDAGTDTQIV